MPWKSTSTMDQRIEFVLRAKRQQSSFSQLCREFEITRPTGYKWLKRYEACGSVRALAEGCRRPLSSPKQSPPQVEQRVVHWRQATGWGAKKIQVRLVKESYHLPVITIHRILKRKELISPQAAEGYATQRFEREAPNQLLQMDFKGEYPIKGGYCYPLCLLDDHSRFLLGLWPLRSQKALEVQKALLSAFREYGVPQALLMDHGTPWWSPTNGHGLTWLSVWLIEQGIQLYYSGIRHPQTQGKVERLHRTLKERTEHAGRPQTYLEWEVWSLRFQEEYNQQRPHEALGMKTPAEVYRRDNLRPYEENPPLWEYGGAHTSQLNTQGCLDYQGQRYFVCEALADKWVRLDRLEHLLLVTFRDLTVREINLRTGRTTAVVLPVSTYPNCKRCPDTNL